MLPTMAVDTRAMLGNDEYTGSIYELRLSLVNLGNYARIAG
jgi:hypothetical protein